LIEKGKAGRSEAVKDAPKIRKLYIQAVSYLELAKGPKEEISEEEVVAPERQVSVQQPPVAGVGPESFVILVPGLTITIDKDPEAIKAFEEQLKDESWIKQLLNSLKRRLVTE